MDGDDTLVADAEPVAAVETVVEVGTTSLPMAKSVKMVEFIGVDKFSNICGSGGVSLLYTRC